MGRRSLLRTLTKGVTPSEWVGLVYGGRLADAAMGDAPATLWRGQRIGIRRGLLIDLIADPRSYDWMVRCLALPNAGDMGATPKPSGEGRLRSRGLRDWRERFFIATAARRLVGAERGEILSAASPRDAHFIEGVVASATRVAEAAVSERHGARALAARYLFHRLWSKLGANPGASSSRRGGHASSERRAEAGHVWNHPHPKGYGPESLLIFMRRRMRFHLGVESLVLGGESPPDAASATGRLQPAVRRALDALPDEDRCLVVRARMLEMPVAELAAKPYGGGSLLGTRRAIERALVEVGGRLAYRADLTLSRDGSASWL